MSPSEKDLEVNLLAIDAVRDLAGEILRVSFGRIGHGKPLKIQEQVGPADLIEAGRLAEIAERTHDALADLQKAIQEYGPYTLQCPKLYQ